MPAGCLRSICNAIVRSPPGFSLRHAVASPSAKAKREGGMATTNPVAQHYGSVGIAERVLAAVRAAHGPDAAVTVGALAPPDQVHSPRPLAAPERVALPPPQGGRRPPALRSRSRGARR